MRQPRRCGVSPRLEGYGGAGSSTSLCRAFARPSQPILSNPIHPHVAYGATFHATAKEVRRLAAPRGIRRSWKLHLLVAKRYEWERR